MTKKFWKWPSIIRSLSEQLDGVRVALNNQQSQTLGMETALRSAHESEHRALAIVAEQRRGAFEVNEELVNAKTQVQKLSDIVSGLENRIARGELETERVKAELSKTEAELARARLDEQREKDDHKKTRRALSLTREFIHVTHRIEVPSRRGIKAALSNGIRHFTRLILLFLPLIASAQFPPPFWRNAWTTNVPPRAVTGQDNLSVTNLGSGTNWLFYEVGPKTIARLIDISNVVGSLVGGTNVLIQTNGVTIGSIGTLNWTTNVTGYVAGAVVNLGVTATGGSSPLEISNVTYVTKNGNDGTGIISRPDKPFLTISNAVQASPSGFTVKVAPGLYNESVILKNGVNISAPSGVIVSQSVSGLPVFFDNGANVTNTVRGDILVIHTGAAFTGGGLNLTGNGVISVDRMEIRALADIGMQSSGGTPTLSYRGKVFGKEGGIVWNSGALNFVGESYGTNDYGCRVSDPSSSNYLSGFFYSSLNSAIHVGGGIALIENAYCVSTDNSFGWGVEQSGGDVTVKDSILQPSKQEAIGKYGGNLMVLDACELRAGTNCSFSIDNGGTGSHGSIEIRNGCWANLPANPAMNIVSGTLLVTNTFISKQTMTFASASFTNIMLLSNGPVSIPLTNWMGSGIVTNDLRILPGVGSLGQVWTLTNASTGAGNWSNAPAGTGGVLTTNANQFLGVPLSIISGAFQTNMNFWGDGTNNGSVWFDGGLFPLAGDVVGETNLPWKSMSTLLLNLVEVGGGSDTINITAPSLAARYDLVFPDAQGANGTVITNNGSGTLGWWDATALIAQKQFGSANLTNWSNIPTGAMANVVSTTFLTNWVNSVSNLAQTKQNGDAVLTNLVGTVARNVTNFVSLSTTNATSKPLTNSYAAGVLTMFGIEQGSGHSITVNASNIVSANDWAQTASTTNVVGLSNFVNSVSNLVQTKQNGSAVLTNLVGTVANNVTNVVSLSTTNTTSKPLTNSYTSGVLTIFGLEAGTGTTVTPNGSNLVIATTVTGAATNANQFGASTTLTLKDGLLTTNLNNFSALSVTGAPGLDRELRLWNTNGGGYTDFSPPTNAWLPTNKLTFAITNPSAGQILKFQAVSFASGVASITVTNDSDNNPTLTTNANQFSGVPLSIKDGALFTNLNNFSILSVTNQPGLDRGLRFWHTNGQAYTELSGPTNQWLPTNKFFLTITNPVANQVLKFQNVSYANGVASIVLTNDSDSAGTGTNMLIQTNGTDVGIAGTVNWTTGVTGYLAGVVANLGVSVTGGSSGTNFDSIIITNQVLYQKQHFKSAGSGANTNQIDFTLATHKGFTNALTTNIVCQLTNMTVGASCVLSIYGADGAVIASNYTVKVTGATNIFWLTSTNGNVDFIVTSNKVGLMSLFVDRSTNVFAAWREQVP